jgi:hypothetical protein
VQKHVWQAAVSIDSIAKIGFRIVPSVPPTGEQVPNSSWIADRGPAIVGMDNDQPTGANNSAKVSNRQATIGSRTNHSQSAEQANRMGNRVIRDRVKLDQVGSYGQW